MKNKKLIIIIISIIVLILGGLIIFKLFNKKEEVKVLKSIDLYEYHLKDTQTKVYKQEFDELEKILSNDNIDDELYAKQVAKLFIIDFYTLDNKKSKNDIGGLEFIKEDMKDNFIEQARSTFYKYLQLKEERTQKLPKVKSVNIEKIEKTTFKYKDGKIDDNAYKVIVSWEYKEDLGYEKETIMTIIKEDKKMYIVEMN